MQHTGKDVSNSKKTDIKAAFVERLLEYFRQFWLRKEGKKSKQKKGSRARRQKAYRNTKATKERTDLFFFCYFSQGETKMSLS